MKKALAVAGIAVLQNKSMLRKRKIESCDF